VCAAAGLHPGQLTIMAGVAAVDSAARYRITRLTESAKELLTCRCCRKRPVRVPGQRCADPRLVKNLRALAGVLREPADRIRPERVVRKNALACIHVQVAADPGSEPFQRGRQDRNRVRRIG
jgi:hypothetical protein